MWNLDTLQTLLRAALKIGGGYLLARGLADNSTVEALIASALALAAVLWGILHRNPDKPRQVEFTRMCEFRSQPPTETQGNLQTIQIPTPSFTF